jgi:hypothetical protein
MTLAQLPTLLTLVLLRRLDQRALLDRTPARPQPHAARCAWCVWREGEGCRVVWKGEVKCKVRAVWR